MVTGDGVCEGRIAEAPRGANGFGYDPIFLIGTGSRTMAELTDLEKHAVSHRGQAVRAAIDQLSRRGDATNPKSF